MGELPWELKRLVAPLCGGVRGLPDAGAISLASCPQSCQDAVEGLVAAFLLPARDLRSLQRYQAKVSGLGPQQAQQQQGHGSGGGGAPGWVAGAAAQEGLIKSFNPLTGALVDAPLPAGRRLCLPGRPARPLPRVF